ncbi:coiled-coil domain-containing protein 102A-like isoform X4 [Centruroides vittatus]|uniref:coiled-coil domain-containing protein 102A-like isoform X4 n=1 Tax=Centruroides vittatus TaxID=120091 RepID=UPI0035104EA4
MSHSGSTASSVKRHISGTSNQWSETPEMPSDISQHSLSSHHHHNYDPEWEAKEELRLRELEEARARAAQMEKTMRWWSDCTANWREKWSKVRTERNKVREEARVLRGKLEAVMKECNTLKREKQDLETEVDRLRKEMKILGAKLGQNEKKNDVPYVTGQIGERVAAERDISPAEKLSINNEGSISIRPTNLDNLSNKSGQNATDVGQHTNEDLEFLDKLLQQKNNSEVNSVTSSNISSINDKKSKSQRGIDEVTSPIQELTEQKIAMLQLRLDEASKTISIERQEKSKLMKTMEKLQTELSQLRDKYENLKKSRQDTLKELNQMKAEHQDEIDSIRLDLEDEANNRTTLDQRLSELRAEELADLKHAHGKIKKVLQDKSTELAHALRRSEQYEAEVKKLRGRIEELKKDLATAEDEVDSATNNIRKLQRSNDELQEQVESLQVQVEHLQSREREPARSSPTLVEEPTKPCPASPPHEQQPAGGDLQ